jgi:hypothetical protein
MLGHYHIIGQQIATLRYRMIADSVASRIRRHRMKMARSNASPPSISPLALPISAMTIVVGKAGTCSQAGNALPICTAKNP